jgi:hypothetical protein
MPGYFLIEQKYLSPPKHENQGIKANSKRIGFTDFLRELESEPFPYNENTSLLVYGLEDVLLEARPNMESRAKLIHNKLDRAAQDFERNNCPFIQIVFRCELLSAAHLWVRMLPENQPIYLIFGDPVEQSDERGNIYYTTSFNLH